jgi:predicted permease
VGAHLDGGDVLGAWALLALKLLVVPVLTWCLLRPFIADPVILGVFVVISAMPIAAASTMLSIEYGGDEKLATRCVFLSTLLSVATLPLMVWLLLL